MIQSQFSRLISLAATSFLLLCSIAPCLQQSAPQLDPRQFFLDLQRQWKEHGIPAVGAKVQIDLLAEVRLSEPPIFRARDWRFPPNLPWACVFGANFPELPAVEWIGFPEGIATSSEQVLLEIKRDQIATRLTLNEQHQLLQIEVLPLVDRKIPRVLVKFALPPQNASEGSVQVFQIPPTFATDSPPDPSAKKEMSSPWGAPLLTLTASADLPPRERYNHLLQEFQSAKAIHFDATARIKWSANNIIQEVGRIQLQMRFAQPHFGRLEMRGWVGEEGNRRQAHSIILGSKHQLMFLDAIQKTWTPIENLQAISDGMKGIDPLCAWTGVKLAPPLSFTIADVPGKEHGWTGFAVESKHLTSVYRFDPQDRLVGVAVAQKGPQNQRQVMEYRFHGLELRAEISPEQYPQSLPTGFKPKVKLEPSVPESPEPLSTHNEFEKTLLPLRTLAPDKLLPALGTEGSKSLSFHRGKHVLLVFWLEGSPPCEVDMKKFDQYWPRANKTDPNAILYKIPASQTELLKDFQVRYFPSFYLIDPKGEISFRMVGWDPERLQAAFDLE